MHTGRLIELMAAVTREALAKHKLWGTRCRKCGSLYEDHSHHGDLCPHQEGPCTGQVFEAWHEGEAVHCDA